MKTEMAFRARAKSVGIVLLFVWFMVKCNCLMHCRCIIQRLRHGGGGWLGGGDEREAAAEGGSTAGDSAVGLALLSAACLR